MKKILAIIIPLGVTLGCVNSLDDYNVDQKNASTAPPVTLFTNGVKGIVDIVTASSVNNNNFRLYMQNWTTTTYLQEPRYNVTDRTIPQGLWQPIYTNAIANFREAKRLVLADEFLVEEAKNNQLAQLGIMEVYAWSFLLNTFGDVPYSEALDIQRPLPSYDDAATVYTDLLAKLDSSLGLINNEEGAGFEGGDILYGGNMEMWSKFGNSLKLRMAMVIADSDPAAAKALVAEAAPKVISSNDEITAFRYLSTPPNNNPVSANLNLLFTTRQDYIPAEAIVNLMNDLKDPRRPSYFSLYEGEYMGGLYGFSNAYSELSHVSDKMIAADAEALLMDYSEVEFLLAEAVERDFISGDAAEHYTNAVTASINYWGGSAAEATAYLAQPQVKYSSAAGTWKEKIGVQKWLALYNRAWEEWTEWRRLDFPELQPPTGGNAPPGLAIPVRMIYPINEQTLNGASREAAASAIGGDQLTTKLWWDVN